MKTDFVHLRVQSSYSMLQSTLTIEEIVRIAKDEFMPAVCIADIGNLFGSLEFALNASKAGLQPIHGSILNLKYFSGEKNQQQNFAQILLIAKDEIGYKNLLKLVGYTYTKNDRSQCNHITFEDLKNYHEGIIALSGYTEGIIGKLLLSDDQKSASSFAQLLQDLFKDRFYFEIMRHDLDSERLIEKQYLAIATSLGIPVVATNNVLFSDINMHDAHDVLLCISAGVTREQEDRKRVSNQCYFKSSREMKALFKDIPEAIENSQNIAKRCYVMSEERPPMLPKFSAQGISEEEIIRRESTEGLLARLENKFNQEKIPNEKKNKIKEQYFERLEYELSIICSMDFSGYFLIVSDFIKWSKERGISVGPGRGSGVGSIVAWSLLITDLDPLKFGLLFERFLNPERISMPDFDIDFCQERREEVINYVRNKYGDERVGQIITFGKLQAKAVIKDVSRVLSLPYKCADYLTELVPFNAVNPVTLRQAITEVAELKHAYQGKGLFNLIADAPLIKQVLTTALILEGLHRHASVHAAGIVIAGQDLTDIVPIYKDLNSNMLVVQYSMKYAELAGLMKFDFLGLQTLTVITKCKKLLAKQDIDIDFNNINYDDVATYQMLSKGHSTGVFQFESVGMKDALRRLKPDCIGDIIALGALYRPGPMDNIPTYIACKHNRQAPDYLHPLLKPILEETYSVIIYQEQVLEIAKALAGYSLGNADLLRRAMGKKFKSEMDAQEEMFISGAKKNNIPEHQAQSIFNTVAKFAGYGFNKAHASAYGVISYQTAYLKANYPAQFLVACLNLEMDNSDKINLFFQEARVSNIKILPPDINISGGEFSIAEDSITYAFGAIKNVTTVFGKIVEEERSKSGEFKNIIDFVQRMPQKMVNRRLLENLIKAGCFDKLHDNRASILVSIPKILAYAVSYHEEKTSNQFSLIAINSIKHQEILLEAEQQNIKEKAFDEFEVLGLFIKNNPLFEYQNILTKLNIKNSANLINDSASGSSQVNIAGVIQRKDTRMSKRGRFITLQLSDPYGIFELTIYSEEVLRNYGHLLEVKSLVVATCDMNKDEGGIKLTARSFAAIDDVIKGTKYNLRLLAKSQVELDQLVFLLAKRSGSSETNANVQILLPLDADFVAKISLPDNFCLEVEDIQFLKKFDAV